MTQINGVHHITLRVSDLGRAAAFYERVLGVEVSRREPDRYRFRAGGTVIVRRPPLAGTAEADRFSERRIGLDHIALRAADRAELERMVATLAEAGVATEGIQHEPAVDRELVCFRDPDNIQWELFAEQAADGA